MASIIPYGHQYIDQDDIDAVVEALKGDFLTTGPTVEKFEQAVADYVGANYAVAVSSGTAALHAALHAIGVAPGDEVIVPALTFAATANAVVYCGGTPVFADVEEDTLCIDPMSIANLITKKTKCIVPVDYAGQPCYYKRIKRVVEFIWPLPIVADSCHALGASLDGEMIGSLTDMTCFSFHPVKVITTFEGGMITTNNKAYADRMRQFRNHGGAGTGNQTALGYNYRLSDVACALGLSQLKKLPQFIERRRAIAKMYDEAFAELKHIRPLSVRESTGHAYHLYVIKIAVEALQAPLERIRERLRGLGVGTTRHYRPTHLMDFYRQNYGTNPGQCPVAEDAYEHILSIPIYPSLSDGQVQQVIEAVKQVVGL